MGESKISQWGNRSQAGEFPTPRASSQKTRLLEALRAAGSRGLDTTEMLHVAGYRYSSRVHDLRQDGAMIVTKPEDSGLFRYVLQDAPESPKSLPDYATRAAKALRDTSAPLFAGTDFRP